MNESDQAETPESATPRRGFVSRWIFSIEAPIAAGKLDSELEANALPSAGFFFMLALSAAIATFGLLANSAAVIIGAMIIAPLMHPIMAAGFATVRGNVLLLVRSLITVAVGVAVVVGIAYLATKIVGSRVAGSEILARSNPNLLDLGVAVCAGAAGAFAVTRRRIANAIPGVAIAVALVPPLCVCGIGLSVEPSGAVVELDLRHFGEIAHVEEGAIILFLTNLSGIFLFSALVFLSQGYGAWVQASRSLVVTIIAIAVVSIPLVSSMRQVLFESRLLYGLLEVGKAHPEWEGSYLLDYRIDHDSDPPHLVLDVSSRSRSFVEEEVRVLEEGLERFVGREVEVEVNVFPYTTIRAEQAPSGQTKGSSP